MKKFITLLCVAIIGISGILGITYYFNSEKIRGQEQYSHNFIQTEFKKMVQSWNPTLIPTLYIENAEVYNIALVLAEIKEDLGLCKIKTVSACESQEKYKNDREDAYKTSFGYSIRCPFVLTCEKENEAIGEAILAPNGHEAKLLSFKLTYGE